MVVYGEKTDEPIMHMWTSPDFPLSKIKKSLIRAHESKYLSEYRSNCHNQPV